MKCIFMYKSDNICCHLQSHCCNRPKDSAFVVKNPEYCLSLQMHTHFVLFMHMVHTLFGHNMLYFFLLNNMFFFPFFTYLIYLNSCPRDATLQLETKRRILAVVASLSYAQSIPNFSWLIKSCFYLSTRLIRSFFSSSDNVPSLNSSLSF